MVKLTKLQDDIFAELHYNVWKIKVTKISYILSKNNR